MSVIIETSVGDVTIDLLIQERPKCCYNFLKLCKMKFYNHCRFHRLEKDFIAQTGDPTGTGEGGHSIFHLIDSEVEKSKYFAREVVPKVNHTRLGTVSMVNNGDDMHGSQFFITLREDLDYLDGVHTVFGYVVEGLETLSKMNELFFSDIIITHTVVLKDPFDDPPSLISKYPDASPEPSEEIISRMCVTHNIEEKPEEDSKERESKAAATILEMIGDLPSEDVKPPDNVLFVCKLNPVTKEEDLEVIFSRFGPIKECEIIKDHKTGDSLQYGFIEFENVEDCEKAYFKMDNVLIDDRRIHVDFSQSVAKIKWFRRSDREKGKVGGKEGEKTSISKHESSKKRDGEHKEYKRSERHYSNHKESNKDYGREREKDDYHKKDRKRYLDNRYDKKDDYGKRRNRSRDRSREKSRDRAREQNRDRSKERIRDRSRERSRERSRDRGRDRSRERNRDRSRDRRSTKDRDRDSRKDRYKEHKSSRKDRDRSYDRDDYRDNDRDRERYRDEQVKDRSKRF